MKKQMTLAFVAVLCAGSILAGCGSKDQQPTVPPTTEPTVAETVPETSAPPATTEPTVPETTAPAESTQPEKPEAPEAPTGSYVDLDNMQFSINGKTYTLGKTTLQDLINDGVPFDEDDVANAGNNLNKNTESQNFGIELGEYWTAQVSVLNDTDGNKKVSECYINEIYMPVKKDMTQDILTFAFPLDMTMDSLKANAGEPTDSRHYDGDNGYYSDTLEYTRDAKKYIGDTGYTFEFTKGVLAYVTIEYRP